MPTPDFHLLGVFLYHPSTRLLTILELLQARGRMSGPELARRLEVSPRSVRRYVAQLQDMGIPVEAERGRYGRYCLRPGYKLPPLMFTDDEALALTVGLLLVRRSGALVEATTAEGALAKLDRVLPEGVRARVAAVQEALVLEAQPTHLPPVSDRLAVLSTGVRERRRVRLRYRSFRAGEAGEETLRDLEPYGVVHRGGFWYAVGYCHLRRDVRVFRLDRVRGAELLEATFSPPEGFDALEYVNRSLATMPDKFSAEVLLKITLEEARRLVPPAMATLEPVLGGVVMRCTTGNLAWLARVVAGLPCDWKVSGPPELKEAVRALAREMLGRVET